MRALVVEDELALQAQLKKFLQSKGFAVECATNGKEALYLGNEFPMDVVLLDLGLPDVPGLDLIRQWRGSERTFPILVLTARSRWQEKVGALEAGADDYVVKPFFYEELWARINALVRRAAGKSHPVIKTGPIEMDTAAQEVKLRGAPLDLTAFEYKVLEYLILNEGRVISKADITEHLYDQDFDRDSNVIEVFIGRLRKKLDPDGSLQPIETLRGRGYRLMLAGKEAA